ncbi:MAG: TRAP transporter large permease [Deltaproteobacteria bacterium]|nr:TRAP transporter large permease [Deltaproteobacteria bacterium]
MLGINLTLLVILLTIGVPIFAVFIGISLLAGISVFHIPPEVVVSQMVSMVNSYILLALPMFLLAGFLMTESGSAGCLVDFFEALLGHLRGGLALALIVSVGFFSAFSGSTLAAIVAIGSIMLPRMKAAGYSPAFSAALLSVASIDIIPPSNFFILYCAVTETSVGQVFAAGLVPGLLLLFALVLASVILPEGRITTGRFNRKRLMTATIKALPVLGMPALILGTIFAGILTAVEAGAMAAFYIIVIDLFFYRGLKWPNFLTAVRQTVTSTAMIYLLLAGIGAIVTIFQYTGFPTRIANIAKEAGSLSAFIVLFVFVSAILGTFLDAVPTLYILAIMLFTTASALGFDPVHFGVFLCMASLMGMATPPMAIGLYTASAVAKISPHKAVPYGFYFVGVGFVVCFIVGFFPGLSLWFVNLIYG